MIWGLWAEKMYACVIVVWIIFPKCKEKIEIGWAIKWSSFKLIHSLCCCMLMHVVLLIAAHLWPLEGNLCKDWYSLPMVLLNEKKRRIRDYIMIGKKHTVPRPIDKPHRRRKLFEYELIGITFIIYLWLQKWTACFLTLQLIEIIWRKIVLFSWITKKMGKFYYVCLSE